MVIVRLILPYTRVGRRSRMLYLSNLQEMEIKYIWKIRIRIGIGISAKYMIKKLITIRLSGSLISITVALSIISRGGRRRGRKWRVRVLANLTKLCC